MKPVSQPSPAGYPAHQSPVPPIARVPAPVPTTLVPHMSQPPNPASKERKQRKIQRTKPQVQEWESEEDISGASGDSHNDPTYKPVETDFSEGENYEEEDTLAVEDGLCSNTVCLPQLNKRVMRQTKLDSLKEDGKLSDLHYTDAEESEGEQKEERRDRKQARREKITDILTGQSGKENIRWDFKEEDMPYLKLFRANIFKSSKRYGELPAVLPESQKKTVEKLLAGEKLDSTDNWRIYVSTMDQYEIGLRRLLEEYSKANKEDYPEEEEIRLADFFNFPDHVYPEKPFRFVENVKGPQIKSHMFCANNFLLLTLLEVCNQFNAWKKWMRPMRDYTKKRIKKAKKEHQKYADFLASEKKIIRETKKVSQWIRKAHIQSVRNKKDKAEMEGIICPDPTKVISKFLESDYSIDMEKKMFQFYDQQMCPTRQEILSFGNYALVRCAMEQGNRTEAYGKILLSTWCTRKNDVPFDKVSAIIKANQTETEKDLLKADKEARQLMGNNEQVKVHGFSLLEIAYHKTSDKYNLWILINPLVSLIFEVYEFLRFEYLSKVLKWTREEAMDGDKPFFISTQGTALVNRKRSLNCEMFGKVTGCHGLTNGTFREMMSNEAINHKNLAVRAGHRFSACHGTPEVLDRHYVSPAMKQAMGIVSELVYLEEVTGVQYTSVGGGGVPDGTWTDPVQTERQMEVAMAVRNRRLRDRVSQQEEADKAMQKTKLRQVTGDTRYHILKGVVENLNTPLVTVNNKMETFGEFFLVNVKRNQINLKSSTKKKEVATRAVMRLLDTSRETTSTHVLQEHFLEYVKTLSQEICMDPEADEAEDIGRPIQLRQIEHKWSQKVVEVLRKLARTHNNGKVSIREAILLLELKEQTNNPDYIFGNNERIISQLDAIEAANKPAVRRRTEKQTQSLEEYSETLSQTSIFSRKKRAPPKRADEVPIVTEDCNKKVEMEVIRESTLSAGSQQINIPANTKIVITPKKRGTVPDLTREILVNFLAQLIYAGVDLTIINSPRAMLRAVSVLYDDPNSVVSTTYEGMYTTYRWCKLAKIETIRDRFWKRAKTTGDGGILQIFKNIIKKMNEEGTTVESPDEVKANINEILDQLDLELRNIHVI